MFGTRIPKRFTDLIPEAERFPARELSAVDSLTTPVRIDEGRVLMREGEPGSEALFILEGDVIVERDGEPVAELGPGSIVGEAALITNQPRNATVTASSEVVAVAMTRREFSTILDTCPTVSRAILQTAVDRGVERVA